VKEDLNIKLKTPAVFTDWAAACPPHL